MRIFLLCTLVICFLTSCDKISSVVNKGGSKVNHAVISAELLKIKNKNNIAEINSKKCFSLLVQDWKHPAAVLFYSEKSIPCIHAKENFAQISGLFTNKILLAQVNLYDNNVRDLGVMYNISSVPTFIMFNNGKEISRLVGNQNALQVAQSINETCIKK